MSSFGFLSTVRAVALTFLVTSTLGCTLQLVDGPDEENTEEEDDDDPPTSEEEEETPTKPGEEPFVPPESVTIEIVDALIQPWMADKTMWDGLSSASLDEVQRLADALAGASPYTAAFDLVSSLANDAYAPPDPYAWAELWKDGAWMNALELCTMDNNDEDTFAPVWPGSPSFNYEKGWSGVRVTPDMRIRVSHLDEDFSEHDSIGAVELNYDDVIAALKAKQIHPIQVDDQGQGQVLFVSISVLPE